MHIYAVLIIILKYCFIVDLFEKWRFIWASHLGILGTQLGVSPRVIAPNPDVTQGGMA
jgi:hypothetical protein